MKTHAGNVETTPKESIDLVERRLLQLLSRGLPLTDAPYTWLADQLGETTAQVIARIDALQQSGVIKRLGLIVNHHRVGYCANAMVVWNIADELLDSIAPGLAAEAAVTLCYQRPRRLPQWRFNLFTMIHGQSRQAVLNELEAIIERLQLGDLDYEVLFSLRQYKQQGARLAG